MNFTLPTDSNERKEIPITSGVLRYFPAALAGVARVSKAGNDKHNPGEPLHHARGKSTDHADCIVRHLMDVQDLLAAFEKFITGPNMPHDRCIDETQAAILAEASQLCWRALALSQELHERFGAPLAPGARLPDPAPSPYADKIIENACASVEPHPLAVSIAAEQDKFKAERDATDARAFPITPGVYLSRKGQLWTVGRIRPPSVIGPYDYPAREVHNCMCWTLEGRYWTDSAQLSEHDLVERVSDLP